MTATTKTAKTKIVKKCKVEGAKCPKCKYAQVVADPRGGTWYGCLVCREVWKPVSNV